MTRRILVADDDRDMRALLCTFLRKWDYEVVAADDGEQAWRALQAPGAPRLAIVDWQMPRLDGAALCRRVRNTPGLGNRYLILLTAKDQTQDLVAGFEAGADDYLTKPFAREELRARVRAGLRMLKLQTELEEERHLLAARVRELEAALEHVRVLQGILPICMYCKRIRDGQDYWHQLEAYISRHSDTRFSHGICPSCYETNILTQMACRGTEVAMP